MPRHFVKYLWIKENHKGHSLRSITTATPEEKIKKLTPDICEDIIYDHTSNPTNSPGILMACLQSQDEIQAASKRNESPIFGLDLIAVA